MTILKKFERKKSLQKTYPFFGAIIFQVFEKNLIFQLLNMKDVFGEGTSEDEAKEKKKRKKKEMKKEATSEDSDEPTAKKARKNQASQIISEKY